MEIRPILSALARNKTGAALVALQVALSLAILANALYVVSVRQAVAARPSGIAAEEQVFYLEPRTVAERGAAATFATQRRAMLALGAVPGVASVALVSQSPMGHSGWSTGVTTRPGQDGNDLIAAHYQAPGGLARTWGLVLREGRDLLSTEEQEDDGSTDVAPRSAVITRALAELLYPGAASVVGKPVYLGSRPGRPPTRIVGVVERLQSPGAQSGRQGELSVITPLRAASGMTYTVRAEAGQRERVMRDAEAALRQAWDGPVIITTGTMQQDRAERYHADHALAWALVVVSLLLLAVTASGIVGIASLWVAQRRKQIGVRRALGARRVDVLRYFITENVMITSAGVAGGVLLGLALNQMLVSQLELPRLPPAYLAAGAALFWLLGVAAVYGPARRGAAISPAIATRGV